MTTEEEIQAWAERNLIKRTTPDITGYVLMGWGPNVIGSYKEGNTLSEVKSKVLRKMRESLLDRAYREFLAEEYPDDAEKKWDDLEPEEQDQIRSNADQMRIVLGLDTGFIMDGPDFQLRLAYTYPEPS